MKYKLVLFLVFVASYLPAQQSARIRDLEKERSAALAEIEQTNLLLNENKKITSNAINRLSLLLQQINSRKKVINVLNQEIEVLDKEISFRKLLIKSLEEDMEKKKKDYAVSVRKMYAHKNVQDNLLFILSAKNFTQTIHRIRYLKEFSIWNKLQADKIVEKQNEIHTEKLLLENNRQKKLELLDVRQTEEDKLNRQKSTQNEEVKSLEKDKKKLMEELAKKQRQANALNREIERIIAEEIALSEKKAEVAGSENRVADEKGGYAMTPVEKNLSSSFEGNKGSLPFPLKGNYKIVGYFGVYQHEEFSLVKLNNNGIEIETTPNNEANAVFEGIVSRIFTIPGFKNSIIIRHGNYLTLYSNIEQVYVKQGNKVKLGQALGKIYTDNEKGNSTLHFELWKEQTKLDPLPWLNQSYQ
ncbi:MAG: peptidoglycan DD-metalloendopeptidase family protein [Dysgonamonadaceae bacterium]|jgi:septal ring factor EnvC (AmiA/AmiB activator)|nr:peptidoglycan DD-metalloendopeptidase family protein [Dysgonamonadaceae bacterium]